MIDLSAIESAARAATPTAWQLVTHKGNQETWIRFTPPIDDVEEFRPLYATAADPATVLALCRIARAALNAAKDDTNGTQSLAVWCALRDAGLV